MRFCCHWCSSWCQIAHACIFQLCLQAIKKSESQVPDMICLCGRIYKDKFVDSDYSDQQALTQAITWWVNHVHNYTLIHATHLHATHYTLHITHLHTTHCTPTDSTSQYTLHMCTLELMTWYIVNLVWKFTLYNEWTTLLQTMLNDNRMHTNLPHDQIQSPRGMDEQLGNTKHD